MRPLASVGRVGFMDRLMRNQIAGTKKTFPLFSLPKPSLSSTDIPLQKKWIADGVFSKPNDQLCREEKIYGMEIPVAHGGLGISTYLHSMFLRYLVTVDKEADWIHRIMVPNSLGPAQLLMKYGTPSQKEEYLPKLANGDMTPCFGLTGPFNGSDAAAFPVHENAIRIHDKIRFSCHKRWITLSPIAQLLGLAIRIDGKISLVLVDMTRLSEQQRSSIIIRKHHPIGSSFPNGEIVIQDLEIPVSWVIGGEAMIGHGWKMLMECLHHGRGVSLPSISDGASSAVLWNTLWYTLVRNQFGQPLLTLPAVNSMVADMTIRVYLGRVLQNFYHALLQDATNNNTSSALSAIMKWVMTHFHREVLTHGMDIFAGRGITMGPKNPIAHYYLQNPIPITVEGSNTLTLHLIVPIQTIFEHMSLFSKITDALEKKNPVAFYGAVGDISIDIANNVALSVIGTHNQQRIAKTILTAYGALIRGKHLRQDQALTGKLGRMITGCVLHTALEWESLQNRPIDPLMHRVCVRFLDEYFFNERGSPRTLMHFEKPSDVRDIAHYFLQPNNLEILEDCLYYDRDSVFARVREQWMLNKDKDPSSFFQSLSPNDHQDMVRVDSYDRTV
jgi:alkylation response protein AidB-like acyl-CoA dehydrogenase